MAQAARTYSYYDSAAPKRAPRGDTRPDVRVQPGTRSENPALKGLSPQVITLFKAVIALVVAVALVCGVRVMFSAATVDALATNQQLESQLEDAQETGTELEIQRSILTSSERIKKKAKALGMVSASDVTYLTVDISTGYIVNEDGSISLSKTLAAIETSALEAEE